MPKTKKWRDVLRLLANEEAESRDTEQIAVLTLRNLKNHLSHLSHEAAIPRSFGFLIRLVLLPRQTDPQADDLNACLRDYGKGGKVALARALRGWLEVAKGSPEVRVMAQSATLDTIFEWTRSRTGPVQISFMRESPDYAEPWRQADSDKGFSALATLYMARFLERYLRYFLEREASAHTVDIRSRDVLDAELPRVADDLSVFALETAPIAAGYAAAWYHKNMHAGEPRDSAIRSFVSYAIKKLAGEVGREGAYTWRSGP